MSYYFSVGLAFLGGFQFLFVALYLFTHKKGKWQSNALLGFVFLMFSLNLFDLTLQIAGIKLPIAAMHLIDDSFFFLYGPLLYFYVQSVVYSDFQFKWKDGIHLLAFLPFASYLVYMLFLVDQEVQNEALTKILTLDLPAKIFIVSLVVYLHMLLYLWFSWKTIARYRKIIKHKFSSIDEINLDWLNFMVRAFFIIVLVAMIHNIIPIFGDTLIHYSSLIVLLVFSFYFVNRVLVKALNQPQIFSGIQKNELAKYSGSNLKTEEFSKYKSQLIEIMEKEKAFLNPSLTIKDLAEQLNTSPKVLSQVINQGFNKNFFDFVNSYRCEEVKNILRQSDSKMTILEAMYQSGFNSKSSFNKEFKKLTHQTPSEFKKSLNN